VNESLKFSRVDELFEAALAEPTAERRRFVARACPEDASVRARVERLVALAEDGDEQLPSGGGLRGQIWEELAGELAAAEPLPPGHQVGRYQVRGLIGEGGMGRVYRAFDPVLVREVAIKALADGEGSASTASRQRLEREARLLARLNHPNVAAIYGFEQVAGAFYLILELVEGETLAERLQRGALPVPEAVAVARQVALALQEAHGQSIVHRDLKPANIKIRPDGRVKVLDFGIAKSAAPAPGRSAVAPTTASGAIVGTPAYMSPEQVRGQPADPRSDLWALGCVLFEMLGGKPAFRGSSPSETLAAVLRDEVIWALLPARTPPTLRGLLRRCLRREPDRRIAGIAEVLRELDALPVEDRAVEASAPARSRRRRWAASASLAAVVVALLAMGTRNILRAPARGPATFSLAAPAGSELPRDFSPPFALAPDGSRVVLVAVMGGVPRLYLRERDRAETRALAGTEGAWQPFFSPDGRHVGFFAGNELRRVSIAGGPVVTLAQVGLQPRGGSWGRDGTIVVAPVARGGLSRVASAGGPLTPLTGRDPTRNESHRWPEILPGGAWALYTASSAGSTFDEDLEVVSLITGERRLVLRDAYHGRYAAGRLFFTRRGQERAVPFDPERLAVTGPPVLVLERLRHDPARAVAQFAVAGDGTFVFGPANPPAESYLAWVDPGGRLTRLTGPRPFFEPRLSPDGRQVAVCLGEFDASELWVLDADTGAFARRAPGVAACHRPTWTPDGRGVTFSTFNRRSRWAILTVPASGPGPGVFQYEGAYPIYPSAWSPDRRFLIVEEHRPQTNWDLRVLEVGPEGRAAGAPRDFAVMPGPEQNAALSPDGRWVAYQGGDPGSIYVAPFAGEGRTVQAVRGGSCPRWGAEGRLHYWVPPRGGSPPGRPLDGLFALDWRPGAAEAPGPGRPEWPSTPGRGGRSGTNGVPEGCNQRYDVDRSDRARRFLVLEPAATDGAGWWQPPVVTVAQ
jgi:eukaryotic-like serine/threonine-protein kinase